MRRLLKGLLLLLVAAPSLCAQLAVRGGTVHVVAGPAIEDGVVLVGRDGKIRAVGPASEVEIPGGWRTLQAAVVTPGLIDAHTVVGLSGHLNIDHDQDQLDRSVAVQPQLRAVDAYNPSERLVEWVRGFGVTTIHTGHAPGALISGQTMVVKTRGNSVEEALVVGLATVAATLGNRARGREGKSPGTRSKAVAMLRAALLEARTYRRKREEAEPGKGPGRDLKLEILGRVLAGGVPLMVTAHRQHDILAALRVAQEFDIRLILDGAAEAYEMIPRIKEAGVPVFVHPPMMRANGEAENASMETPGKLQQAGIPVALQSGYESYVPKTRVVLFEAAIAAAYGMGREGALRAITLDAARILGIADRVGSLEPGKDGDLALFDGDPFETTNHCVATVIEGELVSSEPR